MKKVSLILVLLGLAVPATAQAQDTSSVVITPEAQKTMDKRGYTLTVYAANVPTPADKGCPGPKRSKDVGTRMRNANGGTVLRHWFKITVCYGTGGELKWRRINNIEIEAPSRYFKVMGAVTRWYGNVARSYGWFKERHYTGPNYPIETSLWRTQLFIAPHYRDGGIWFSKGTRLSEDNS
jgi:hypothetical protein